MSRHALRPTKPEHTDYEIVVGWDSMLGNFFGEVRKPRDNDYDLGGEVVISIAEVRRTPPNVADFNALISAISEYAIIGDDLRRTLWDECRNEGTFGDSTAGRSNS
jgi:hypothetical protein